MIPQGIDSLDIEARAFDNLGRTGSDTVTINVIPDPLTTVIGRVVNESGIGVVGVDVQTLGVMSVTSAAGSFTIPDVPTILGNVAVNVLGEIGGEQVFGQSEAIPPVQGGITDVGDIEITVGSGFISVVPNTIGVEGSGIESVRHSEVVRVISNICVDL